MTTSVGSAAVRLANINHQTNQEEQVQLKVVSFFFFLEKKKKKKKKKARNSLT